MAEASNGQQGRAFGLTRASTLRQTESQATQREIIGRACQSLTIGEPTFLDEPLGTSGRSKKFAERPMGLWVLRNLRKGDTLIVTAIDRLGRNFIDQYMTIQRLFDRGVRIVILKGWGGQALDLKKATDRIMLAILAWVADVEAERLSERTREGLQHRRENGLSTGKKKFTYVQAYDADGDEIATGDYNKMKGHHKRNLPDRKWLDQLCELLSLQKATRAQGKLLFDYCRERGFRNRDGKEWWRGTVHCNSRGSIYMNNISTALKLVRRMAVLGQLPEDYNERVLAITGDTPASVRPKWKYKVSRGAVLPAVPSDSDIDNWDADQLRAWIRQSQSIAGTA